MPDKIVITTLEQCKDWVGREVAVGRWIDMTQERIDCFAEATGDRQWIHVDVERCRRESPYRTTIAHGNFTLCLLFCIDRNCDIEFPTATVINYGMNRVRFTDVVPSGSRVRGRYTLADLKAVDEKTTLFTWTLTGECEGHAKPVLVAEVLLRLISP